MAYYYEAKVGDTVYLIGLRTKGEYTYISEQRVIKTTKTTFTLSNGDRYLTRRLPDAIKWGTASDHNTYFLSNEPLMVIGEDDETLIKARKQLGY